MKNQKGLWASFLLGNAGLLMIYLLPLMVGAITEKFSLTTGESGIFASCDLIGYSVTSISSYFWIRNADWRKMAYTSIGVMIIGNVISMSITSFSLLIIMRLLVGFGQGIAVAITLAMINDEGETDRNFAIYLIFTLVAGALIIEAIPFIDFLEKSSSIFLSQAFLALIAVPFVALFLPSKGKIFEEDTTKGGIHVLVILCLIGIMVMFVGYGGLWSFAERIGDYNSFSESFINSVLSGGLLVAIPALLVPIIIGDKYGRFIPLTISITCLIVFSILLFIDQSELLFVIAILAGSFGVNMVVPYMTGIIAEKDHTGKGVVMVTPMYSIGFAIGPLIISLMAQGGDFMMISMITSTLFLLVYLTYLTVIFKN